MVAPDTMPLIEMRGVRKRYGGKAGEPEVEVLHGIDLTILVGEFVALVGASGSGKSTLMHILGCLDRPSSGTYRFAGLDTAILNADELAWLRREAFGFVFQGYHLIPTLDVLHNVQVPAVYTGTLAEERQARAAALLARLGLADRSGHRPNQLSGGQQQRVSIARALMNGGQVVLADEPTGALDSKSGAEVMALLNELADAGHTVILITHDSQVAAQARRVVQIRDGMIVRDSVNAHSCSISSAARAPLLDTGHFSERMTSGVLRGASWFADACEAVNAAWRTLWVSRFRTMLTLLGIVIGVASVIVLTALGQGSSQQMLEQMASVGHLNRLAVKLVPDKEHGQMGVLTHADVRLVSEVPNIVVAAPTSIASAVLRAGNVSMSGDVYASTSDTLDLLNGHMAYGAFFTDEDERNIAAVAVLSKMVRERLFGEAVNPVGRHILVNNVPFLVVGELAETGHGDYDEERIFIPFSTGVHRLIGRINPELIQLKVADYEKAEQTAEAVAAALERARGVRDVSIGNSATALRNQRDAARRQNLLVALVGGISLVVGGIGVMNIMLMAVKERTREIGIRMATGARQSDIQRQFLAEAVMVSLVGGAIGVVIGLSVGVALIFWDMAVIFSIRAVLLAFGCAVVTGLIFGFMPARQASRLDPVIALAGE